MGIREIDTFIKVFPRVFFGLCLLMGLILFCVPRDQILPEQQTPQPISDSQDRQYWSMLCTTALNDTIDDDWVKPDRPDSLSE